MTQTPIIIGTTIAIALGLIGVWAGTSQPATDNVGPLIQVDDPDVIAENVGMPRLGILTSQNYVAHRIRVIEGSLENLGAEPIHAIDLKLTFSSYEGEPILESEEQGFTSSDPLLPGEIVRFSLRYENIPEGWNFRVPEVQIIRIGY